MYNNSCAVLCWLCCVVFCSTRHCVALVLKNKNLEYTDVIVLSRALLPEYWVSPLAFNAPQKVDGCLNEVTLIQRPPKSNYYVCAILQALPSGLLFVDSTSDCGIVAAFTASDWAGSVILRSTPDYRILISYDAILYCPLRVLDKTYVQQIYRADTLPVQYVVT